MNYHTFSSAETKRIGASLAKSILKSGPQKNATIFALTGDLGSGKTTFVQGFFRGLGLRKRATSPTFIILRRFTLLHLLFAHIYHIDAYRIKNSREFASLGLKKILADPKNIVLIEWAENLRKILPKRGVIQLAFRHGKRENERIICGMKLSP